MTIKIGELYIYGSTPSQEQALLNRAAFIDKYCAEKGWIKADLTIEQILEIRQQPEWKNPRGKEK
jgi:hypothetical protein